MAVSNRTAWAIVLAVLAGLVMLSHGWSLDAGLYLDDHSHYAQLRESGWGYQDMVGACRLGIIGRVMHTWFREETGLRFYRPVAFWLMKLQYTLVGWRPVGAHAFSLLWHMAAATLVYILAYKCIGRRFWAGLAASVFAAHPGNILTVYWVACQTELMVVSFILVSFLCYCRYSNWPTPMFAEWSRIAGGPIAPGGQTIWLIGSLVFFALALGCRENAVVLPVLAVAGDLLLRPRQWRRRIMAYVLFAVVFAIYFHLRSKALGGFPMPTRPYMVPPSDPEFFSFIVEKFVYYFLGLFALFPVLPIGGQIYFRENPTLFYVTFVVLLAFWTAWLVLMRRHRGLLLAPLWVVLGMAPVIAVFASGHHLYLPSIGAVLMVAALWAWLLGDCFGRPKLPPGWIRKTVIVVAVAVHLVLLPGACWAFGWVYRTSTEVEDLVIDDVVKHTPDLRDGDKLFFINLSMMAYYAVPAMEDLTGAKHLRGYVLTFSPKLLMMEEPCRVTQLDDRSFSVELERDGYFRGAMGQVLREIMGRSEFFKPGERISSDEFDTIIAETGEEGVRKLVFRFHRPLNSPGYHFYLG
ncbi:MAG: hypothetical protein JXQ73_18175, partial [Phycisphaerae bacterium]|nr:hypothetical protein [Phycisphaerae bacterium]